MTKLQALHKRLTDLGFKCDLIHNRVEIAFADVFVEAYPQRGTVTPWEIEDRGQILSRCADDVRRHFTFAGALKYATAPEERAALIASQRRALTADLTFKAANVRRAETRLAEEQAKLAQADADLKALEEMT